jgi:hypothetical protein
MLSRPAVVRPLVGLCLLILLGLTACSGDGGAAQDDTFGSCRARAGAVCRNEDLRAVSLVAADLPKIDFTGSNLRNADFTDADLSGAKLVDADLSGTDFTGANLTGADFTGALMFGTVLRNAKTEGLIMAAADRRCIVTMPDGSVERGEQCAAQAEQPTATASAPVIEYFRAVEPVECIEDASGTSIEVEWSTRFVNSVTFFVDDIRTSSESRRKGRKQLPFLCDGQPHPLLLQAVGPVPPLATASFTASVEAG